MLCDMVERTQKIGVSPPLFMSQGPEGFTIGAWVPGVNVIPLLLHSNETGGGYYAGSQLAGVASLTNGASTLSEPLNGMTNPTGRAVLVYNPPEEGQSTHVLSPTSQATYGAGLLVGTTTETPPRPVAMWLGGSIPGSGEKWGFCSQSGGLNGTYNTLTSLTYNVSNTAFVRIGTNLPCQFQRANYGAVAAGTNCLYHASGTDVTLLFVDETFNTGCS